ncbi:hypothetical protein LJR219_002368 [Phenylobacterium sp. LjRoot219]|uniref:hypothetical protein n=1 Tax=Phenylobacterium sp. LjRoot219 TaxID=3342283 RepID=UPI003ED0495D
MPPKYVIVMHAGDGATAGLELRLDDEVAALVSARRIFMQECFATDQRPLAVSLGRQSQSGEVDWISGWRSARTGRASPVRLPPPQAGRPPRAAKATSRRAPPAA